MQNKLLYVYLLFAFIFTEQETYYSYSFSLCFLNLTNCLGTYSKSFTDLFCIFIYLFTYLFIFGCVGSSFLCEGFLQLRQVGATLHRGARASLSRPLLLRSTGSRRAGSVVVAHGPSCSAACGIFPDQGSNPCPLHWQADSQPLRHQGSPASFFLMAAYYSIV